MLETIRGLPEELFKPDPEVIGCVLTVGHRAKQGEIDEHGKSAFPGVSIHKDRFRIARKKSIRRKNSGTSWEIDDRPDDERFAVYNSSKPTLLYAEFNQHHEEQIYLDRYGCMKGPRHSDVNNPRHAGPWCTGNGVKARRWDGKRYGEIECPGEACAFRSEFQTAKGKPYTPCKPSAWFYFRPRWPEHLGPEFKGLETPPMKLVSSGLEARSSFRAMLSKIRETAAHPPLSIEIQSWIGMPFVIELSTGRSKIRRSAYPEISFSPDGDTIAWLQWQGQTSRQLASGGLQIAMGAASAEEQEPESIGSDLVSIGPVIHKPRAVAEPINEPEAVDAVEVEASEPDDEPDKVEPAVGHGAWIRKRYIVRGVNEQSISKALINADLKVKGEPLSPEVDRDAINEVLDPLLPFLPYTIATDDPRDPIDRLREYAKDALGLGNKSELLIRDACLKLFETEPGELQDEQEAAVAVEIGKLRSQKP